MAREMMFAEGIAVAITEEMQRDANVVFYGQNMAMTDRDPFVRKFGKDRVRITPISETAELGIAVGAAMISGSAAMARSQPVRSFAAEAGTPG